jgi:phage terminase large subunit GpA-like protein
MPEKMTAAQWAERHRYLSSEASANPGKWSFDRTPYWKQPLELLDDLSVQEISIMAAAQTGKALGIDTPIPTPEGWTTIEKIQVGDFVFNEKGQKVKVTFATEIMHNHICYEVGFSDGSKIIADAEHKWQVSVTSHGEDRGEKVLTTEEMLPGYKYRSRNNYAVPVAESLNCDRKKLPVDPYLLGAWLGDGHSYSASIYCHADDTSHYKQKFEKAGYKIDTAKEKSSDVIKVDAVDNQYCVRGHDKEATGRNKSNNGCAECGRIYAANYVRKKSNRKLLPVPDIVKNASKSLRELGFLTGRKKFIPSVYLRSSKPQRMELLRGLMDTDGYIDKRGRCEFCTTSQELSEGFNELLASLGIKKTSKQKIPTTKYKGKKVFGKKAYITSFMVYKDKNVFSLPRKARIVPSRKGRRTTETEKRKITSIKKVNSVPVKCIQVDSPSHLFLAGKEMIPTHNTETMCNAVAFYIDHEPSPMMLMQPTLDLAETFSKTRLAPMIRDCPALSDKVADSRTRDSGNTMLSKVFAGGSITMVGANSPTNLRSRPIRVLLMDEIDAYPESAGTEGDPVGLATRRTDTFHNARIIKTSTPTLTGLSRIESEYNASDRRKWHVPCVHCSKHFVMEWRHVVWEDSKPETAHIVCPSCNEVIQDADRVKMVKAGEWRATAEFKGKAGFWINGLNSIFPPRPGYKSRLHQGVATFLAAKRGGRETLKEWVNTFLAETFDDEAGETIQAGDLVAKLEPKPEALPNEIKVVTCAADIQQDRIEAEVVGWDENWESYGLQFRIFNGSTAIDAVWNEFDEWLLRWEMRRDDGLKMTLNATAVDSGYNTSAVYRWCAGKLARRIFPIKGQSGWGKPIINRGAKTRIPGVAVYTVGVDEAKLKVQALLKTKEPGPGYCHYYGESGYDDEYFKQLTAEKLVRKFEKGRSVRKWVKMRERNEAVDIRVYNLAALEYLQPNWEALKANQAEATRDGGSEEVLNKPIEAHPQSVQPEPENRGPMMASFIPSFMDGV